MLLVVFNRISPIARCCCRHAVAAQQYLAMTSYLPGYLLILNPNVSMHDQNENTVLFVNSGYALIANSHCPLTGRAFLIVILLMLRSDSQFVFPERIRKRTTEFLAPRATTYVFGLRLWKSEDTVYNAGDTSASPIAAIILTTPTTTTKTTAHPCREK